MTDQSQFDDVALCLHILNLMTNSFTRANNDCSLEDLRYAQRQIYNQGIRLNRMVLQIRSENDRIMRTIIRDEERRLNNIKKQKVNAREKTIAISKAKLNETVDCGVCQETHQVKDCVRTECGHYYCKESWHRWMDSESSNKSCPVCRAKSPKIQCFRAYAKRKPATTMEDKTSKNNDVIDLC